MLRFTRKTLLLVIAAVAVLDVGCSALVDSSRYVGGTAGDGGVDPNGPTAPEIDLTPDPARTDDVLTVAITRESTDPTGADPVTYEYRWLRGVSVIDGQTASTLPADQTTKGDVVRVEVTPVAGARRGAAATAEVTIQNTPPVLVSIGLDTYEPMVGERVRAFAGSVVDADGDPGAIFFQWFDGDAPIASATSATIDTTPFAAGTALRLEAWASDGDEGPLLEVGPITVLEGVTRWRQLLGYEQSEGLFNNTIYDAPHRRVVMYAQRAVFEMVPDGTSFRIAHLPTSGEAPPAIRGSMVLHDESHRRLLVVDPQDPQTIYALDLSRRGAETWRTTTASGIGPDSVFGSAIFYDESGQQFWFYGGFGPSDGVVTDRLATLSVRTPGAEAWEQHTFDGTPPPGLAFPVMGRHPTAANHAILLGGASSLEASADPSLRIFDIDLSGTNAVATQLAATLPNPVIVGSAAPQPGTSRLVIAGGTSDLMGTPPTPSGVFTLDLDAGLFTPLADLSSLSAAGFLVPNPDAPDEMLYGPIVFRGARANFGALEISRIDLVARTVTPVARHQRPGPTSSTVGYMPNDGVARMAFGQAGEATDAVWELGLDDLAWTPVTVAPDSVSGSRPTGRSGIVASVNDVGGPEMTIFGGQGESGPADTSVWRLLRGDTWRQMRLAAGETAPSARFGHVAMTSICNQPIVFGGMDATTFLPLSDAYELRCDAGDVNCSWSSYAGVAAPPSPRRDPVAFMVQSNLYIFGGFDGTSALSDLHRINACGISFNEWTVPAVSGPTPPSRWGASSTFARGPTFSDPVAVYVYGGATMSWFEPGSMRGDVHRLVVTPSEELTWEPVIAAGTPPEARALHVAFWDGRRDRLIVFGGQGADSKALGDMWELVVR